jgi:hypothetical protein
MIGASITGLAADRVAKIQSCPRDDGEISLAAHRSTRLDRREPCLHSLQLSDGSAAEFAKSCATTSGNWLRIRVIRLRGDNVI